MTEQETKKRCFIITPIGGERSDIRDALDGLLKNVLEPVLLELGFEDKDITVAHQMKDSGSINTQLITRIIEDELCIVNLTGLNPNVMYELAIRHAVGKPVVIIAENGTKLPFDIVDQRTIFYSNTMLGAVHLKEALSDMVENIISNPDHTPDNPIIKIIKDNAILDKIKSDGREHSELSLVLNKLSNLEKRIANTEKRKNTANINKSPEVDWVLEYKGNLDFQKILNSFSGNLDIFPYLTSEGENQKAVFRFNTYVSDEEIDYLLNLVIEQKVNFISFIRRKN
ncbi:Uncharacterised protein [Lysinibacillus capsici]|uniref:Nucleoside 2-deoxyribosyltransferase n=1 Tax=Lysinibacillus capsici TaxID=2115968 RepID=A0A2X0XMU6_9BACI|nr:hypothetical protein [Lysinibacillus capsici]SPT99186.1 Uncharacterised protein [Lysinibacillus capsici]